MRPEDHMREFMELAVRFLSPRRLDMLRTRVRDDLEFCTTPDEVIARLQTAKMEAMAGAQTRDNKIH